MVPSVIDYLLQLPEAMHFARVQELCGDGVFFYRMLSEYGNGTFQLIEFEDDLLLILIGDYTPKDTFEKITEISEDYMEISQFETDSSSFKIGGRKKNQVDKGIYCYLNTQKKTYTYCEGGKPVRFTKVILSPKYFNTYFRLHDRNNAELLNSARDYILKNPSLPELNFVFQQIRDCQAEGHTLKIYLESKVMELLSLVVKGMEQEQKHISVKLDYKDIRNLRKTVTVMKNDLAAYPTGEELAQIAGMSTARYQLAFRKYYGTTPYVPTIREDWHFIKDAMRMRDVSPNLKNFILHPAMTIECIYVPLMMAASKTADELTVASVTRGIENPTQRTSYVRIGFGIADLIVVLAFLAMFLVGQFYGEVF